MEQVTKLDDHYEPLAPVADTTAARLAALEQLVAELSAEIAPAAVATLDARGPLRERLRSRKLWLTVATVLTTLGTWLHGNLSGHYAAPIIAAVTIVYLIVQAVIDNTAVQTAP